MNKRYPPLLDDVIIKNICEKKNVEIIYKRAEVDSSKIEAIHKKIIKWRQLDSLKALLKDVFLPKGYPHSVSEDYTQYQLWDTLQAFCSSISGTLSMSAVLEGVGVGSETATPVSATITWIMKDGTGMIGGIVFAWAKGSKLDSDCKKWRLFADILNDIAMCLELLVPYAIHYSVYLLCLSTAMKALVGVAGSATRTALVSHQAVHGNMADVAAKDGSQEIFVNLCAYVFGIYLLKSIAGTHKVWTIMCIFIFLHLFSNYKAVNCIKINSYNGERFRLSLRTFLPATYVPTIVQANRNESVFLGRGTSNKQLLGFEVILGAPFKNAVTYDKLSADDLIFLTGVFQNRNYLLMPYAKEKKILVSFRVNYKDADVLKAYFHAALLAVAINLKIGVSLPLITRKRNNSTVTRLQKISREYALSKRTCPHKSSALPVSALLVADDLVDREFTLFSKLSAENNWNMNKHMFNVEDWSADWKFCEEPRSTFETQRARGSSGAPRKRSQPHQSGANNVRNSMRYANYI